MSDLGREHGVPSFSAVHRCGQPTIMVVDDEPNNIRVLTEALSQDYDVIVAGSGALALEILKAERPHLVLLDIMMPGLDGFEVCRRIKADPKLRHLPVIFLTALTDEYSEEQGFDLGAVDYIHKPFRLPVIRARVRTQLSLQGMMDHLIELNQELNERLAEVERLNQVLNERTDELQVTRSSKELFQRVFMSTSEGILVTDAQGDIEAVNRAFTRITGYAEEEALGQNPRFLKSGLHDTGFYREMWRSISEEGYWRGELYNRRKSGESYPELRTISAVYDGDGRIAHYVAVFSDISSLKQTQERIDFLTWHDALTGLPNRLLFLDRVELALRSCHRSQSAAAILVVDLNGFKALNDTQGLLSGDKALIELARRLQTVAAEDDTLARLGGDEFALLLTPVGEDVNEVGHRAQALAQQIHQQMREPFQWEQEVQVNLQCSIGIALLPSPEVSSATQALQHADTAHHRAKVEGAGTLLFEDSMGLQAKRRFMLENELNRAIDEGGLRLYLQPQISASGQCDAAEALVRWQHESMGVLSPAEFIPLAEQSRLIIRLGHWVLEQATDLIQQAAERGRPLRIAVNISPKHFAEPGFATEVEQLLQRKGCQPGALTLELTESLMIQDVEQITATMAALVEQGVEFSIDDFGTGYSSLAYLRRLPLAELKIDQRFIQDAPVDPMDAEIVAMIHNLAQFLSLRVVAEGVEAEEHDCFLRARFPDMIQQGYHHARPQPAQQWLEAWLSS